MGWRYLWREKPLVFSLADSMLIDHDDLKELDCVNESIDWSRLKWVLQSINSSPRGEKAWPPLLMFKALLLKSGWHKYCGCECD